MDGHSNKRRRAENSVEHTDTTHKKTQLLWGDRGVGDGQMDGPSCIRVGLDGMLYIADTNNHRIQVFTPSGSFLRKWGKRGTADGEFDQPTALSFAAGGKSQKQIQEHMCEVPQLHAFPPGVLPVCTAYAVDDRMCVADWKNGRIQMFSSNGFFLAKWICTAYDNMRGSFVVKPNTCVMDALNGVVVAGGGGVGYWTQHGTFIRWIHKYRTVQDIVVTTHGRMFTTGYYCKEVICTRTSDGRRIESWSHLRELFTYPSSMTVNEKNNVLYVVDGQSGGYGVGQCVVGLKVRGAGLCERHDIPADYQAASITISPDGFVYLIDASKAKVLAIDIRR